MVKKRKKLRRDPPKEVIHKCPCCGWLPDTHDVYGDEFTLEERVGLFEVGGACEGYVLCRKCACEYNWLTGEEHELGVCEHCEVECW